MKKVLVAYTSKTGTTRNYSEVLASALKGQGLEVDVKTLAETGGFDGYDAVLVGSPVQGHDIPPLLAV